MREQVEGTMRRTRHIGVIAGLIGAALALAGCSSSADESTAAAANDGKAAQEDSGGDGVAAPEAAGADRSLIVTGSLYITVEDPIAAADKAAGIVQNAGGQIDARDETAPQGRDGGSASLTLRIPGDKLDKVVDDLRALGTVDSFSTQTRNVTTEVTDLEAKISTLRASTDRIQGLLADAKGISDIIALEDELARRQAELQSLEAQQRGLDDQVSMSTIDLSLTTEPVVIVVEDDSPKTFWDGLVSGWNGLVGFISVVLIAVGVLLPWAALGGLITIAVIAVVRATRSRIARRPPKPPVAARQFAGDMNPGVWATTPTPPAPAAAPAPAPTEAPGPQAPGSAAPPQPPA